MLPERHFLYYYFDYQISNQIHEYEKGHQRRIKCDKLQKLCKNISSLAKIEHFKSV